MLTSLSTAMSPQTPPAGPMASADFLALLALGAAMSFSPGPNTTLSTALAANRGLRAALRFCLAVPVGWTLLLLLCSVGLGSAIESQPALRLGVKGVGVAYLLWMAWQLSQARALNSAQDSRLNVGFWQGVALQFVNIKAWMLALAVVAGWVITGPLVDRLLIVLPTMAAFAWVSNLSYALVGALLRQWLGQGARLLWFNRAMAAVLVLTAYWMSRS